MTGRRQSLRPVVMLSTVSEARTGYASPVMRLQRRQRRALEAICDTFVPAQDGLPSATELGVPDALLQAVESNPRKAERAQVAALLAAWDSAALGALGGAGFRRFATLPQDEREKVLLAWS